MSEESTDSSEQERKRWKAEKKRKKEKKKEEEKKKKEAAGGRGVKEEEAATDIKEVKAEVEDVAVEGVGGGGGLVATTWLRGEAGNAWGLNQANQRNVLTLAWAQGALESGYSPDAPLFSSLEVTYATLRGAFWRMLRHCIRNKGVCTCTRQSREHRMLLQRVGLQAKQCIHRTGWLRLAWTPNGPAASLPLLRVRQGGA